MKFIRRKTLAAASTVALGVGLAVTGGLAPASAAGPETTFLVLAPQGASTDRAVARATAAQGTVVATYDQIGVLVVRSTNPDFVRQVAGAGVESVASTAGLGAALDEGETVELTGLAATTANPTGEPLFAQQWDMPMIKVPQAHAINAGSPDVVVGVLDSGISSSHPDLASQIARDKSASCIGGAPDTTEASWNPTTSDHGTHVAGTIAAAVNGVGVTGVAPGVKVAAVKVVNDDGYIFPEAAVCGFLWAAEHGMQVTNNSYYIDPWELNCRNDARQRPVWQAIQRAIRYSQSKGVLHVASSGNSNYDLAHKNVDSGSPNNGTPEVREVNSACLVLPGEAPGVVTVSAVGPTGAKSYYSSYGQGVVDVTAPGGDTRFRTQGARSTTSDAILSTTFNVVTRTNGWGYKQGTSMSSPHAAGVAALAASAHPGMNPGQLAAFLESTATPLSCPAGVYNPVPLLGSDYDATCSGGARNGFYGAGMVDAHAAVR
ncbi:S8 family peptidase [Micromonospora sagamiensis]|uniref:Subtilase family protein n=1 Tax=Micromonospora sagamiensis TaxID=47875 RepID=A0A562WGB0_9ACTN|nr:S8 family serine peptidase [Micromonospora sagamiensis]TWJ29313.1 subtilase family protein [Micromonospora sagamiensis]